MALEWGAGEGFDWLHAGEGSKGEGRALMSTTHTPLGGLRR